MSAPSQDAGTSEALTVDTAAQKIESLFASEESEPQKRRETKPQNRVEAEPEETEEVEEAPAEEPEEEATEEGREEDSEASEDTEESAPEDDEEPEEPDPDAPKLYKVKVDGEELEVPEDELLRGYSRQQDYTKKTTALAQARKEFEALQEKELGETRSARQTYTERLKVVEEALSALTPPEPDWDKLRTELEPDQFHAVYAEYKQQQERLDKVRNERKEQEQKLQKDLEEQAKTYIAQEREKLVAAIPEWKDPETMERGIKEVAEFMKAKHGFTDEELATVRDHRHFMILRSAMLYDKAQTKKPVIKNKIDKAIRDSAPGAKRNTRPTSQLTHAKQRLAKTGKLDDAAAAIALLNI